MAIYNILEWKSGDFSMVDLAWNAPYIYVLLLVYLILSWILYMIVRTQFSMVGPVHSNKHLIADFY